MRIEFSTFSENIKYKMYYQNNAKLLQDSNINYTEKENLGKKIIDINLEENQDIIIFEVYNSVQDSDINQNSYSLRYIMAISIRCKKEGYTFFFFLADYYLKIYKLSEKDLSIKNTISIIDNLKLYHIFEFTTNAASYTHTIQIPKNYSQYYIFVNAITSDRELLSYNLLFKYGEKKEETPDEKKDKEENNFLGLKWYWIVLIAVGALILIIIIILICICIKKRKGNIIESENNMIQLLDNKIIV